MDELQEGEDAVGADGGPGGFAVEEEGEEAEAEGVALFVESVGEFSQMSLRSGGFSRRIRRALQHTFVPSLGYR